MNDLFLVLAQAPGGLSCFMLPRILPDGERNHVRLMRLKNKLGNRSNASAEVEYDQAVAWLVGQEGRGLRTIMEMVTISRLVLINHSAGLMRQGLAQALHHATHRSAFGHPLIDQPLMRAVVADLAVESEAAIALSMRMAGATDRAEAGDANERALRRIGVAIGKYWVCKRTAAHVAESLECLGGNGYVEDSGMPRLYREAPLNSIWEGSGNVAALDVLRAMRREPEATEAFVAELNLAAGGDRRLDAFIRRLRDALADPAEREVRARHLVELMALALQGSLLVRHGHPAVADAFCSSRLAGQGGLAFGTLPAGLDLTPILERAERKAS
jgi:putative acyl-CoA dehydrogenase